MEERMSKQTDVQSFHKSLKDNGYLCTDKFADSIYCALRKKPMSITMLIGQAGTGKSFLPETLGNVLGCNVYVKQAYQGMDWDEFVRKHVPDENTKSGIKSIDAELLCAVRESKDKKVILLLDEWDKTRISSDSYFLDFLQTGRISVSGQKYQANLDNLIIFFTSNNERDVSEPLLRRVKVIEVEHLPVSLVANVLQSKYKDNAVASSLIEPVLKLYDTSIRSTMDKPATIQELCDLINDWITFIEQSKDADWQDLVYINVTKNERNHLALQKQIHDDHNNEKKDKAKSFSKELDNDYFDNPVSINESGEVKQGFMPKMMKLRKFDTSFECSNEDDSDVFVDIKRNEDAYTSAFLEAEENGDEVSVPYFLGWNKITNTSIKRGKAYDLMEIVTDWSKFNRMKKSDGVIVFNEPFVDKDDVINFINSSDSTIRKGTDTEIIFRYYSSRGGIQFETNVRWVTDSGCEFIVPTKMLEALREHVLNALWYPTTRRVKYVPINTIHNSIVEGNVDDSMYVHIRRLGASKDYLNVSVMGINKNTDDSASHRNAVTCSDVTIKETKRTTTYDLGYATVRCWHKVGYPNYKSDIVIKDAPVSNTEKAIRLLQKRLGGCGNRIPLFINVDKSHFNKCDRSKWKEMYSSRVLVNQLNPNYNMYAINCYDRTTFMLDPKKDSNNLSDMFVFADQLRTIRSKTMDVLC